MSRNFSSSYNISNEHIFLIDILKRMYNDNIHQINNMINSINNIRNTNNQIRNILLNILFNPNISNNSNRNYETPRNNSSNQRENTERENFGRVILDNVPYVIDSIQQYTLPFTDSVRNRNTSENRNNNLTSLIQNFFQPVEVYPTQSQIEIATRNVRYCDILNPVNRSCPITLDTFTDSDMVTIIRFCGHVFRQDQLNIWFRSNCRCPVCRYDIRTYNSNNPSSMFESSNSVDSSNNSINENISSQPNEERNIPEQSTASTITSYLDLFIDNTLNDFSNINDPTALYELLRALQNQRR
jgi:hypothetical protein